MIELYSAGHDAALPLDSIPDDAIEFMDDFETLEDAAEAADIQGCGWYLWSRPEDGRYLGSIRVVEGSKPEIREF
jgi:hypothetical protein